MALCELCPRRCLVDREGGARGACGQGSEMRVARVSLHPFEEPCLCGEKGAGTVFFSGCSLGCVFCQNRAISRTETGRLTSPDELANAVLGLQDEGAQCIDLVTPTHFADRVAETLRRVRPRLSIPVVWNSSGYERVETLKMLEGLVDVYMPDFKYASCETAARYAAAPDYPEVAAAALAEMVRQTGAFVTDERGMAVRGTLIRVLVLPGERHDAVEVLRRVAETVPASDVRLSLMSQYTPDFAKDTPYSNLHRRLTRFEYETVVKEACRLGFEGYVQDRSAASAAYTPDF